MKYSPALHRTLQCHCFGSVRLVFVLSSFTALIYRFAKGTDIFGIAHLFPSADDAVIKSTCVISIRWRNMGENTAIQYDVHASLSQSLHFIFVIFSDSCRSASRSIWKLLSSQMSSNYFILWVLKKDNSSQQAREEYRGKQRGRGRVGGALHRLGRNYDDFHFRHGIKRTQFPVFWDWILRYFRELEWETLFWVDSKPAGNAWAAILPSVFSWLAVYRSFSLVKYVHTAQGTVVFGPSCKNERQIWRTKKFHWITTIS